MTGGITINQGAADDEIFTLKSSDVSHNAYNKTENDSFFTIAKVGAGGAWLRGWADTTTEEALYLHGISSNTGDTTKSSSGTAGILLSHSYATGGNIGAVGANVNLVAIRTHTVTAWICDEDGDTWQSGNVSATGVQAIGAGGLRLSDDSDTLGIFIEDGGEVGIGHSTPLGDLHIDRGAAPTKSQLVCSPNNAGCISILSYSANHSVLGFDVRYESGGWIAEDDTLCAWYKISDQLQLRVTSGATPGSATSLSNAFFAFNLASPILLINEGSNANMTGGITINQGAADDEILAFKASEVAHGGISGSVETDTFGSFQKRVATTGGLTIQGFAESGAPSCSLQLVGYFAGATDTTKSSSGRAIVETYASEFTGGGTAQAVDANGNIFAIRSNAGGTRWICDEDGDTWQTGNVVVSGGRGMRADTADGSDTSYVHFCGGGSFTNNQGAHLTLYGNEHATDAGTAVMSVGDTGRVFRILNSPLVCINDSENANMTIGLTINQVAYDDEILAFKSSDVAQAWVSLTEADTYGFFRKYQANGGGHQICGVVDHGASFPIALELMGVSGVNATTLKTTSGYGIVNVLAQQYSGDAAANIVANGNVFSVRCRVGGSVVTRFIVDEDGDFFYDGTGAAFDDYEDAQLVRAFSLATSKDVIRTEWDEAVRYNEASLVEAGILGDTVANGGLVNGAQLQRLHNGAIWQLHQKIETQALQIENLESKLKLLEM
jgi:hypothetical protein